MFWETKCLFYLAMIKRQKMESSLCNLGYKCWIVIYYILKLKSIICCDISAKNCWFIFRQFIIRWYLLSNHLLSKILKCLDQIAWLQIHNYITDIFTFSPNCRFNRIPNSKSNCKISTKILPFFKVTKTSDTLKELKICLGLSISPFQHLNQKEFFDVHPFFSLWGAGLSVLRVSFSIVTTIATSIVLTQ